jgi:phage tail-like protein
MNTVEFRRQVFRTPSQWAYGAGFRLQRLEHGGFALFSRLGFSEWVSQTLAARCAGGLTIGACGRIFWTHRHDGGLYRLDPASGLVERVIELADCGGGSGPVLSRVLNLAGRLWVLDRASARAIALRTDTFQIIAEIALNEPADLASGGGRVFSLNREGIRAYDSAGRALGQPHREPVAHPVALGADPGGRWLYVIDSGSRAFLRFSADGRFQGDLGSLDEAGPEFRPRLLAVQPGGNLFVSDGSPVVHEFAADGGYIGSTGTIAAVPAISDMTFDASGRLYLASPAGIARLNRDAGMAGNDGVFYTGTLDNGSDEPGTWHRADLVAEVDGGGAIDVFYATSDDPSLVDVVGSILARGGTPSDTATAIEGVLRDQWRGPEVLSGGAFAAGEFAQRPTHSMLFSPDTKRYLWLKVVLSGLAPRSAASVRELRIFHPRLSYLRYLPAVYQEDKLSREFLERYLSMFETVLSGLEAESARVPELFDPDRTPPDFLDWLAQWLDLGFEEDWPVDIKRRLLARASHLYEAKGTPAGLAELIEIVTRHPAIIRESFETDRPHILGEAAGLGAATYLRGPSLEERPAAERFRLGDASYLGQSALRTETTRALNPFRAAANRFTVALDLSSREFQRHARSLHRIIREHSPAHADYDIRLVSGAGLGAEALVGINLRVEDPQPLHLGHSALGRSICMRTVRYGPELGIDAVVTGPNDETGSVCALPYGER